MHFEGPGNGESGWRLESCQVLASELVRIEAKVFGFQSSCITAFGPGSKLESLEFVWGKGGRGYSIMVLSQGRIGEVSMRDALMEADTQSDGSRF